MPLILSREEVQPLLNLSKAIELTEDAFKQQANGEVVPHAPYHIPVGGHQALRVVSGALRGSRRVGVRLGPNSGLAGGNRMYALLFDTESGELLSFMGFPFGTLRTAAHIALAARYMAREDSHRLGLFGVGRNAFGILGSAHCSQHKGNCGLQPRSRAAKKILRRGGAAARRNRSRR